MRLLKANGRQELGSQRPAAGTGRITKRMQRDATVVSTIGSGRKAGSFAGYQQFVEGAPLMRVPLGGNRCQSSESH